MARCHGRLARATLGNTLALARALLLAFARRFGLARRLQQRFAIVAANQAKLDAARFEVNARNLHRQSIRQAIAQAGALTAQFVQRFVEVEIFGAQFRYVHEALDKQIVENHKCAERNHGRNGATVDIADTFAHEVALEPGLDVARGIIGAPLVCRANQAELLPQRNRRTGR